MQLLSFSQKTSTSHAATLCTAVVEKTAWLVSAFLVANTIDEGCQFKKLENRQVLLEPLYKHQCDKLPQLISSGEIPATANKQRSLNTVHGAITDGDCRRVNF